MRFAPNHERTNSENSYTLLISVHHIDLHGSIIRLLFLVLYGLALYGADV